MRGTPGIVGILGVCGILCGSTELAAQPAEPVRGIAVDARGVFARFKEDPAIAQTIDVSPDNLPTRGLGIALGAHWYPVRLRRIAIGLGGEVLWARDSRTAEPATATDPEGPTVTTRLSAMSPHVSLNFGSRDGWSYISGGIGTASLSAERGDLPFADDPSGARMTHYGGGARWFTGPHLAFTFDLRFYAIDAALPAGTRPAFPRTRLMVISVGASFR